LVKDIHHAAISALEWSSNGMRLFCGDMSGVISATDIDCSSVINLLSILKDNFSPIQGPYTYSTNSFLIFQAFYDPMWISKNFI